MKAEKLLQKLGIPLLETWNLKMISFFIQEKQEVIRVQIDNLESHNRNLLHYN
jgi:hypothetical protein